MQRVFRVVDTAELTPVGTKTTGGFDISVRDNGVVTPILVAEVADEDGVICLQIIDGNRRVRAARNVGLTKLPAVVLKETTAEERGRLTLICNHLRSLNFYTESLAAASLGDDVEREARRMGLSAAKVLGMLRKLEQMPAAVRTAMYEERLQVSSATDIAGWPPALQAEVVALLERRGQLGTRAVIALKEDWEARHGPINPRAAKRHAGQTTPPPTNPWEDAEPVPIDSDVTLATVDGWRVRPVEATRSPASPGPNLATKSTATIERSPTADKRQAGPEPVARSADLVSAAAGSRHIPSRRPMPSLERWKRS